MKQIKVTRTTLLAMVTLATLVLLGSMALAQSATLQGIIDGRRGATMTVKSADGSNVVVLLSDNTDVQEVEGGLHMRKKSMGLTALVPGLPVEVKGSYNAQNQLAADSIKFKASELKRAQAGSCRALSPGPPSAGKLAARATGRGRGPCAAS